MIIAILGYGVVGSGVARLIAEEAGRIEAELGLPIELKYILNRSSLQNTPVAALQVDSIETIVTDPAVDVVVEAIGGIEDAYTYTVAALEAGKHVVTSNKEIVARYGPFLLDLAAKHEVTYLYEAAVGGGMPLLRSIREDLAANRILALTAILNGTSNFILDQMASKDEEFDVAVAEAKSLGYAESDPTHDINGMDSTRKLAILASRIYRNYIAADRIAMSGIEGIRLEHIHFAKRIGGLIKPLVNLCFTADKRVALVSGAYWVPASHPLYGVNGVYNAAYLNCSAAGDVMYVGKGAGSLPTASSVLGDLYRIGRQSSHPEMAEYWSTDPSDFYLDRDEIEVQAYAFPLTDQAQQYLESTVLTDRWAVERLDGEEAVYTFGLTRVMSEADLSSFLAETAVGKDVFILRILK